MNIAFTLKGTAEDQLKAYRFTDNEILQIALSEHLMATAAQMASDIWVRNNYIHISKLDCAFLIKKLKQELL